MVCKNVDVLQITHPCRNTLSRQISRFLTHLWELVKPDISLLPLLITCCTWICKPQLKN